MANESGVFSSTFEPNSSFTETKGNDDYNASNITIDDLQSLFH